MQVTKHTKTKILHRIIIQLLYSNSIITHTVQNKWLIQYNVGSGRLYNAVPYPANINVLVHRVLVGHQDPGDLHDHVHDLFQIWDYHHELQLRCGHLWASHSSSSWGCHQWGGSPGGGYLAAGSICKRHRLKYRIKHNLPSLKYLLIIGRNVFFWNKGFTGNTYTK